MESECVTAEVVETESDGPFALLDGEAIAGESAGEWSYSGVVWQPGVETWSVAWKGEYHVPGAAESDRCVVAVETMRGRVYDVLVYGFCPGESVATPVHQLEYSTVSDAVRNVEELLDRLASLEVGEKVVIGGKMFTASENGVA